MTAPVRLERWAVRRPRLSSPYAAPETVGIALRGDVVGHPRRPDGSRVTTSPVVRVSGRLAWTASGTCYELAEPDPRYVAAMAAEGRVIDAAQPIKMVGGRARV